MGTLKEAALGLQRGLEGPGFMVYAGPAVPGRFGVEEDLEVLLKTPGAGGHLLFLKLYHGRGPHHLPWAELFGIEETFYGSKWERRLLEHLSGHLGAGSAIFVEYEGDEETKEGLARGVPPAAARLGFMLYRLGFTWFKDWYFPEGALEGGRKLQGEKPVDGEARGRHVLSIRDELGAFLREASACSADAVIKNAVERARRLLQGLP
jgi:hypothetical protein